MEHQGTFEKDISSSVESAGRTVGDMKQKATEYAREIGSRAVEVARDRGVQGLDLFTERVRRDPIAAVCIAAGVGLCLGILFKKSS